LSQVSLGNDTLHQELSVENPGPTPFDFTAALHTYFKVADASKAVVIGLAGTDYLDSLQGRTMLKQEADEVIFTEEVDRIYCAAPDVLRMEDRKNGRVISIEKVNFPDAVIWNPYVEKARKMVDFGNEEWREMVCVEVARAGSGATTVMPGRRWIAAQRLVATKL
jgi:glucose-6-phosphate 1-epimerase